MHGPLNAKIHPTSSPMCVGGSLHGIIKFPDGETYNILPSCSEVKNACNYTYITPFLNLMFNWTVHHLHRWIKRDQLDVTCFIISLFSAQHVSDVNTSILRSLRLLCWVISWVVLIWFDVCWCYFVVWLWWCGIRMQAEALVLQPAYGYHTTIATLQRNTVCRLKH